MSKIHHCVYKKGQEMKDLVWKSIIEKYIPDDETTIALTEDDEIVGLAIYSKGEPLKVYVGKSYEELFAVSEYAFGLIEDFSAWGFENDIFNEEEMNEIKKAYFKEEFYKPNFIDDKEKMADFLIQTKKDFLDSYSYLTEEEYNNTSAIYWG